MFIYLDGDWVPVGEMTGEKNPVKASSVAKRTLVPQSLLSLKHHASWENVTTPFYHHLLGLTSAKPVKHVLTCSKFYEVHAKTIF